MGTPNTFSIDEMVSIVKLWVPLIHLPISDSFAEHIGKVILFKTPLFQYAMNPVNYKERQVNTPTDFG